MHVATIKDLSLQIKSRDNRPGQRSIMQHSKRLQAFLTLLQMVAVDRVDIVSLEHLLRHEIDELILQVCGTLRRASGNGLGSL